jgi:hypothetical protein
MPTRMPQTRPNGPEPHATRPRSVRRAIAPRGFAAAPRRAPLAKRAEAREFACPLQPVRLARRRMPPLRRATATARASRPSASLAISTAMGTRTTAARRPSAFQTAVAVGWSAARTTSSQRSAQRAAIAAIAHADPAISTAMATSPTAARHRSACRIVEVAGQPARHPTSSEHHARRRAAAARTRRAQSRRALDTFTSTAMAIKPTAARAILPQRPRADPARIPAPASSRANCGRREVTRAATTDLHIRPRRFPARVRASKRSGAGLAGRTSGDQGHRFPASNSSRPARGPFGCVRLVGTPMMGVASVLIHGAGGDAGRACCLKATASCAVVAMV